MFIFDFLLVVFSLAPLGLFLVFWKIFPQDRGVYPIYKECGIESVNKRTEVRDAITQAANERR